MKGPVRIAPDAPTLTPKEAEDPSETAGSAPAPRPGRLSDRYEPSEAAPIGRQEMDRLLTPAVADVPTDPLVEQRRLQARTRMARPGRQAGRQQGGQAPNQVEEAPAVPPGRPFLPELNSADVLRSRAIQTLDRFAITPLADAVAALGGPAGAEDRVGSFADEVVETLDRASERWLEDGEDGSVAEGIDGFLAEHPEVGLLGTGAAFAAQAVFDREHPAEVEIATEDVEASLRVGHEAASDEETGPSEDASIDDGFFGDGVDELPLPEDLQPTEEGAEETTEEAEEPDFLVEAEIEVEDREGEATWAGHFSRRDRREEGVVETAAGVSLAVEERDDRPEIGASVEYRSTRSEEDPEEDVRELELELDVESGEAVDFHLGGTVVNDELEEAELDLTAEAPASEGLVAGLDLEIEKDGDRDQANAALTLSSENDPEDRVSIGGEHTTNPRRGVDSTDALELSAAYSEEHHTISYEADGTSVSFEVTHRAGWDRVRRFMGDANRASFRTEISEGEIRALASERDEAVADLKASLRNPEDAAEVDALMEALTGTRVPRNDALAAAEVGTYSRYYLVDVEEMRELAVSGDYRQESTVRGEEVERERSLDLEVGVGPDERSLDVDVSFADEETRNRQTGERVDEEIDPNRRTAGGIVDSADVSAHLEEGPLTADVGYRYRPWTDERQDETAPFLRRSGGHELDAELSGEFGVDPRSAEEEEERGAHGVFSVGVGLADTPIHPMALRPALAEGEDPPQGFRLRDVEADFAVHLPTGEAPADLGTMTVEGDFDFSLARGWDLDLSVEQQQETRDEEGRSTRERTTQGDFAVAYDRRGMMDGLDARFLYEETGRDRSVSADPPTAEALVRQYEAGDREALSTALNSALGTELPAEHTELQLLAFQRRYNREEEAAILPEDGQLDLETARALLAEGERPRASVEMERRRLSVQVGTERVEGEGDEEAMRPAFDGSYFFWDGTNRAMLDVELSPEDPLHSRARLAVSTSHELAGESGTIEVDADLSRGIGPEPDPSLDNTRFSVSLDDLRLRPYAEDLAKVYRDAYGEEGELRFVAHTTFDAALDVRRSELRDETRLALRVDYDSDALEAWAAAEHRAVRRRQRDGESRALDWTQLSAGFNWEIDEATTLSADATAEHFDDTTYLTEANARLEHEMEREEDGFGLDEANFSIRYRGGRDANRYTAEVGEHEGFHLEARAGLDMSYEELRVSMFGGLSWNQPIDEDRALSFTAGAHARFPIYEDEGLDVAVEGLAGGRYSRTEAGDRLNLDAGVRLNQEAELVLTYELDPATGQGRIRLAPAMRW